VKTRRLFFCPRHPAKNSWKLTGSVDLGGSTDGALATKGRDVFSGHQVSRRGPLGPK